MNLEHVKVGDGYLKISKILQWVSWDSKGLPALLHSRIRNEEPGNTSGQIQAGERGEVDRIWG